MSHASKVMLKILQVRLQQYVNCKHPDVQAGFRKTEEPRSKCQHLLDHRQSKRVPEKHLLLLHWLRQSLYGVDHTNFVLFWKRWDYQTSWHASWEICMQVRKQQLELDMEQDWFQIGKGVHQGYILLPCLFNFYAEYIIRNAGLGWRKHKLESRLPGDNVHRSTVYNSQDMETT